MRISCPMMHKKTTQANLEVIAHIASGYPFRGRVEHDPDGQYPLVQLKSVIPFSGIDVDNLIRVSPQGRRPPTPLKSGDILFANRGTRLFGTLVEPDAEGSIAAPHFFIVRVTAPEVLPEYLAWFLNSKRAQKYYRACAAGTALPHITSRDLKLLPIPIPSLEKQEHVVAVYRCWLKERRITEDLIDKRENFISNVLDAAISN